MAHPHATLNPQPFTVSIPQSELDELKQLIKAGRLPPATFEGTDPKYGVTTEWMKTAKETWINDFDWSTVSNIPLRGYIDTIATYI